MKLKLIPSIEEKSDNVNPLLSGIDMTGSGAKSRIQDETLIGDILIWHKVGSKLEFKM